MSKSCLKNNSDQTTAVCVHPVKPLLSVKHSYERYPSRRFCHRLVPVWVNVCQHMQKLRVTDLCMKTSVWLPCEWGSLRINTQSQHNVQNVFRPLCSQQPTHFILTPPDWRTKCDVWLRAFLLITFEFQEVRGRIGGWRRWRSPEHTPNVYIYKTENFPSPKITAAFPFLNISTKNVVALAGSNLLTSLRWKTREWPRQGQGRSLSAPSRARESVGYIFFMTSLFYKKQTNKALFSVLSIICDLTREESKLSAGTVITSTHYSYKSLPPDKTNAWTIFNLATANKWSDRTPPHPRVRSHLPVKNALNLVGKISLLGDDRKEPRRGCRINVESETERFQGQFFPNSCTFAPNARPVTSVWISHTSSSFLKLKPQGNDVWEFPTVTAVRA